MKFEQKVPKKNKKRKVNLSLFDKEKTKEIDAIYPVRQIYDTGEVVTVVKNGLGFSRKEYSCYLAADQYDLMNLSSEELETLLKAYSHFHKSYRKSMKELFLSFPENNLVQQEFIQEFMENGTDNQKLRLQQKELDKLRYLETLVKYSSFIQIYAPSLSLLEERFQEIKKAAQSIFPTVEKLKKKEVKLLISLYNNGVQAIKRQPQRIVAPSDRLDVALTSPQGGWPLKHLLIMFKGLAIEGQLS